MLLRPFKLERYFAQHEFSTRYLLCSSDCEAVTLGDLLALEPGSQQGLNELSLGYTSAQGTLELRNEIVKLYPGHTSQQVLVHGGAQEAIYNFIMAVCEPDDHLIVVTPCYQSLQSLGEDCGLSVTSWPLREEKAEWSLDIDALVHLIRPTTRALIVNFPHNPTGYLPTLAEFERLIAICRAHGILLFSDEVYRGLEFGVKQRLPAATTLYENAVSLGALSKAYGLAGLRIGWVASRNTDVVERMASYKDYLTICNSASSEFLATIALRHSTHLMGRCRNIVETNLKHADSFFARHEHFFSWARPNAGPVAFVRLLTTSCDRFCDRVRMAHGVLVMPGSVYAHGQHHVRFGFGRANFSEALAVLEKGWQEVL